MKGINQGNTTVLMWGIRLAALAVGGSVSVVAIAALVTAIPAAQTTQKHPLAAAPPDVLSAEAQPQPIPSPSQSNPSPLPAVYPLTPPITPPNQSPKSIEDKRPTHLSAQGSDVSPTPGRTSSTSESNSASEPSSPSSPVSDMPPTPENSSAPDIGKALTLTLQDVVILALENNRQIKNAYLQRIIDQEALRVAEDRFNPTVTPLITINARRSDQGFSTSTSGDLGLATEMQVTFPSGTELSAGWNAVGDAQNTIGLNRGSSDGLGQNISVGVSQPLWRGSGEAVNRAPVRLARLQEEKNILGLQTTLIGTITQASGVYFSLVLAQQRLEIEQAGLVRTEAELDRIEALIEVGREAGIKRIEAEADVANRQVLVLDAKNSLRDAQLELIKVLDISQDVRPLATETNALDQDKIRFADDDTLVEYALANNPAYQSQLLDLNVETIQLLLAEDRLGWDFDLTFDYTNDLSSRSPERSEARAGLQLSRELGDRSLKQQVIAQKTRIEQLENDQTEERENLEISIRDAIRNVDFQLTQVEQAQRATQLAAQQLEITQFQFRQGTETFLDVVQAQDRLVASQNQELSAQIGYQQALLRLDEELGHTLTTWNIQVQSVDLP